MDTKLLMRFRDLLMRVHTLLQEDVEELGEKESRRHCACLDEIELLLKETEPPKEPKA